MNRSTLPTFTLVTLVAVLAGASGCDESAELDPETAAELLADEAVDPELLAELELEALELEEPELDGEPDPDAPVCLVFVPSADEREADPEAELETRCYESRAAMEGTSGWLDNPHAEEHYNSTMYYLGEGFEHSGEGGASYVFVSSTRCGAGPISIKLGSMPAGWNDRLSSYVYRPWSYAGFLEDSTCNGVAFYEHSNFGGSAQYAALAQAQGKVCTALGHLYTHIVDMNEWNIVYPAYTMNDKVSSMVWIYDACTKLTFDQYWGDLSGAGDYEFEPDGTYYYADASARHRAYIAYAPWQSADFDLRLWWWNGSAWTIVASSMGWDSNESIDYMIGAAGYYIWEVRSYSGSGSYELDVLPIP